METTSLFRPQSKGLLDATQQPLANSVEQLVKTIGCAAQALGNLLDRRAAVAGVDDDVSGLG